MTQDWARRLAAIKADRERRGMTQVELADAAGIAESTVQNLEGGRSYTSEPHSLHKVEAALRAYDSAHADDESTQSGAQAPTPIGLSRTATGMPLHVQHELAEGQVVDTEIIDLSRGGMRMVVVVTRDPGEADDDDQVRRDLQEWSRVQRRLRKIASTDAGDQPDAV